MEYPKCVVYKGTKYFLQSTGRYYQDGHRDAPERLLHRRIWADAHGPIPEGYAVHHKNGDWTDNSLENLELLEAGEHQRIHQLERMAEPEFRRKALDALGRAQVEAAKWHSSDEGREWHKEHGRKCWEGREPVSVVCEVCGKEYQSFFPTRAHFCSKACRSKAGYFKHKTASGVCAFCGKPFVYNKYRKQECCSRTCAIRMRCANKRLQPDT